LISFLFFFFLKMTQKKQRDFNEAHSKYVSLFDACLKSLSKHLKYNKQFIEFYKVTLSFNRSKKKKKKILMKTSNTFLDKFQRCKTSRTWSSLLLNFTNSKYIFFWNLIYWVIRIFHLINSLGFLEYSDTLHSLFTKTPLTHPDYQVFLLFFFFYFFSSFSVLKYKN